MSTGAVPSRSLCSATIGERVVAGAVVGDEQPPIREALSGERGELSGQEPCAVIRTQQYGDSGHEAGLAFSVLNEPGPMILRPSQSGNELASL